MQLVTSEELNEAHRNQTSEVNDAQTVQLRRRSVTIATLAAEKDEALAAMVAQVHLFHSLSCNCGTSQSRCLTKQRQHAERLLWQFRDPICCRLSSSYSRCFSALSLPPMPLLTQLSLLSSLRHPVYVLLPAVYGTGRIHSLLPTPNILSYLCSPQSHHFAALKHTLHFCTFAHVAQVCLYQPLSAFISLSLVCFTHLFQALLMRMLILQAELLGALEAKNAQKDDTLQQLNGQV